MLDQAMLDSLSIADLREARDQIVASIAKRERAMEITPLPIAGEPKVGDRVRLVDDLRPKYLAGATVEITGMSASGQPTARILTQKAGYKTFRLNPKYIAEVLVSA